MLNDRIISRYFDQRVPILRILTDRGTEYKGTIAPNHAYQLLLSIQGIERIVQLMHILCKLTVYMRGLVKL